jgi:hypothetical protein
MTRARSLKKIIRARASKTGESYTTARRHVLAARTVTPPKAPAATAPPPAQTYQTPRGPALSERRESKGAVSDEKIKQRTGHGLDHWFAVLDRFDALTKGHTAAADHLYAQHGVPGWHAQGITVAYERARGRRAVNQRSDGYYYVSVSKVLPVGVRELVKIISDKRRRTGWIEEVDRDLAAALVASLAGPEGKPFVIKDNGDNGAARHRYKAGRTLVELLLEGRPGGKTSMVAVSSKLADAAAVDRHRSAWRGFFDRLHRHLME